MTWVVVNHNNYDGVDVVGPFASEEEASCVAGKPMRVVHAGVLTLERKFVAVEACVLGGITVYGWFPSMQAAEAFCHRQSLMSPQGVRFAAVGLS